MTCDCHVRQEDADESFAAINLAYGVLSDPVERGKYDRVWQYGQSSAAGSRDGGAASEAEDAARAAALEQLEVGSRPEPAKSWHG